MISSFVEEPDRAMRGGAWPAPPRQVQVDTRSPESPRRRYADLGWRLVRRVP